MDNQEPQAEQGVTPTDSVTDALEGVNTAEQHSAEAMADTQQAANSEPAEGVVTDPTQSVDMAVASDGAAADVEPGSGLPLDAPASPLADKPIGYDPSDTYHNGQPAGAVNTATPAGAKVAITPEETFEAGYIGYAPGDRATPGYTFAEQAKKVPTFRGGGAGRARLPRANRSAEQEDAMARGETVTDPLPPVDRANRGRSARDAEQAADEGRGQRNRGGGRGKGRGNAGGA